MASRTNTFGLLFLAVCIAYCSAARCNGNGVGVERGTQTPIVWQWKNNPHRWWHEYWSPMRHLVRPQLWSRAMDHFGGFPMFPLPMGDSEFTNRIDHLFDEMFEDPWDNSEVRSLEDDGRENRNCLCARNEQEHQVGRDDSDLLGEHDQGPRTEDAVQRNFPRYQNTREQIQQNQRNTRGQFEQSVHDDHHHQHKVQNNARNIRSKVKGNSMGGHPSNQQPTYPTNNLRQNNQRPMGRETTEGHARDIYGESHEFHTRDGRDLHRNEDRRHARRFNNDQQGTGPNNRESRMQRENTNGRFRTRVSRPVEVYSLNVPGYKPGELQVKVEGRKVRVIGRQACSCRESCSVREFERVTVLPDGIDTRDLQATINKEGTLSVQSKNNHRLSRGHYEDRDILVEGLDLPPIEDSSKNTENCVKKAGFKLAKMDKRTGKRVPVSRQFDEVPQKTFDVEQDEDGVTIEVVEE